MTAPRHVKEASDILGYHLKWVSDNRPEWKRHRAAWGDRFWDESRMKDSHLKSKAEGSERIHKVQINLVRPTVVSNVSSLYYKGLKFEVTPDELIVGGESKEKDEKSAKEVRAVQAVTNRFFATENVEDAAERLYQMGLLYRGGCGFKIGRDDPDSRLEGQKATDLVWVEAIPPWEAMWDRRARSIRDLRYIGHYYPISVEDAKARFKYTAQEEDKVALPDVVENGYTPERSDEKLDASYVWVLEIVFPQATHEVKGKATVGEMQVYIVRGAADTEGETPGTLIPAFKGPVPYAWANGEPVRTIIPFIPEPVSEAGMDSISPIATIYELNAELNRASSILATAYRRDSSRVIAYLKDKGVDDEVLDTYLNGGDMSAVGIEGNTLDVFKALEMPAVSDTLLKYRGALLEGIDQTQLLADFTRGKAGDYLSATEVANLVNYTETTIGRIRKRMDLAAANLAQVYTVVLAEVMDVLKQKHIDVRVGGEAFQLKPETLRRRWKFQVLDTASTPQAAATKRADFLQTLQPMMELATIMGVEAPMAEAALEFLVEVMDLPKSMAPATLIAKAPPPPEEPEASPVAPQPGPPGAPLPQEVAGVPPGIDPAALATPEVQAILAAEGLA